MDLKTKIFEIEAADEQYQALEKLARFVPKDKGGFLVIGLALVSYQLSWTGELWRKDVAFFAQQIKEEITKEQFLKARAFVLKKSKYNRRLQNMKLKRLQYFLKAKDEFLKNIDSFKDLGKFNKWLSDFMDQPSDAKTIVFATKIRWRWLRVWGEEKIFPFDVKIPLDSRWIKFFHKIGIEDKKYMQQYIKEISTKLNIPPLHIDWILWPIIGSNTVESLQDIPLLLARYLGISSNHQSPDF